MKKSIKIMMSIFGAMLLFSHSTYAVENKEIHQLTWGEALNKVYTNTTSLQRQDMDLSDAKESEYIKKWELENMDFDDYGSKYDLENAQKQAELSLKNATLQKEVAQDTRISTQQKLKIQLYEAYYELLQAQEELEQREIYRDYTENLYNQSKEKKKNGLLTDVQLQEVEIQSMKANYNYKAAVKNKENVQMQLNILMAEPLDTIYEIADEFYIKSPDNLDLESGISSALENRSEFKEIRQTIEINNIQMELLDLNMFKSSPDYKDLEEDYDEYVWENKKLSSRLKQQEYIVKKNVHDGYNDLQSLFTAIRQEQVGIQFAENEWFLEQARLKMGTTIESKVLEKRYALLVAELNMINAKADYTIAHIKYLAATNAGPAY